MVKFDETLGGDGCVEPFQKGHRFAMALLVEYEDSLSGSVGLVRYI